MTNVTSLDVSRISSGPPRRQPLDIRHVVVDDCRHPLPANGVYQVARQLTREQSHAGDEARIFLFRRPDALEEENETGTDWLPLHGRSVRGRLVSLNSDVSARLMAGAGRQTFVHIHGGRQPLLWSLTHSLRRRRIPYGITIHGRYSHLYNCWGERVTTPLSLLYLKTVEQSVLNNACFVQAVSSMEASVIGRIAPKAAVVVIPNAAYSSALDGAPAAPRRTAPSPQFPVFGFCGRYEIEHKGLDLLLEGFALYRRAGGTGRLALVGTGPARDELAATANSLELSDAVKVDGPLFGAEKHAALANWDFFVQSSRFEGAPIGVLEAALLGLPPIVTAATGLTGQIASFDAGIVIEQPTATAVAEALGKAGEMPPDRWVRSSRNAYALSRSIGDWTAIAEQLRSIYER